MKDDVTFRAILSHNSLDFGRDVLLVLTDVLCPAMKVSDIVGANQGYLLQLGLLASLLGGLRS